MPRENRNPPKQLTGPQGMTTLLAESNERFARLEEKLDGLTKLLGEVLALVTPAEETEDKAKSKAKK